MNFFLNILGPFLYWFESYDVLKEEKDEWLSDWLNEKITTMFVEQPRLHRVC